eukprot:TRINITY_DN1299_c0_g1_i3.p2 TRINITY_DN1299_c0_g1~~TRINITY_DN1299_c0_g1_i3.p2  ORF type:complete len:168 (-),score=35.48 TRINITY_DN1299_c0_g1_i3:155-658(-)
MNGEPFFFIPLDGSPLSVFDYYTYQSILQSVVYNAPTNTFFGVNVSVILTGESNSPPYPLVKTERGYVRANPKEAVYLLRNLVEFDVTYNPTFKNIGSPHSNKSTFQTYPVGAMLTEDLTLIIACSITEGQAHLAFFPQNGSFIMSSNVFKPGRIQPITFLQYVPGN